MNFLLVSAEYFLQLINTLDHFGSCPRVLLDGSVPTVVQWHLPRLCSARMQIYLFIFLFLIFKIFLLSQCPDRDATLLLHQTYKQQELHVPRGSQKKKKKRDLLDGTR